MGERCPVRRVVIIVDTALESTILELITKAGERLQPRLLLRQRTARGLKRPLTGRSRVRIEIVERQEVAESIMALIHQPEFAAYLIIAYLDSVEVDSRDQHLCRATK